MPPDSSEASDAGGGIDAASGRSDASGGQSDVDQPMTETTSPVESDAPIAAIEARRAGATAAQSGSPRPDVTIVDPPATTTSDGTAPAPGSDPVLTQEAAAAVEVTPRSVAVTVPVAATSTDVRAETPQSAAGASTILSRILGLTGRITR